MSTDVPPPPPPSAFTAAERRLVARLPTPSAVQAYLNALPYNTEPAGATLRSFRGVVREGTAHCFESAMFACVVLEQHGYPALVLSFESIDGLDHTLFAYQGSDGRWGSVARSRDPGLHGRKPVFDTPRALALTYVDPYVDYTGGVTGYAVADMNALGRYDWRFSSRSVWKAERYLLEYPHHPIHTSKRRTDALRRRYVEFRDRHDGMKPVDYTGRDAWTPIPREFARAGRWPFAGAIAARRGLPGAGISTLAGARATSPGRSRGAVG